MKKTSFKKILYYLIPVIISMIITTIGYVSMNGIPLFNVPKIEDVSYVEISDIRLNINARKFTEIEDIEKAINLTNVLLYKLGKPEQKEPTIELVLHLKDGKSFLINVNEKTVCINGKRHSLKGDKGKVFIKVTEGIFFFNELVEIEGNK